MHNSGLRGHVSESTVPIVAKQMRSRFRARGKALESRSVHQKNVEPAIVVVIVEGNAAAGSFQEIFVLVLAAEDGFRVEAGLSGDVEKPDAQIVVPDLRNVLR